jgi:hypothetical protein
MTLTLSEESRMSYVKVIATARRNIPLTEIDVKSVEIRKAMTGAIIIKMPGDKGREKASRLATYLTRVLDPTTVKVAAPTRTAELRVVGIDISIEKEELRQALSLAAGCQVAEVQVGKISTFRDGLESAYVKCPVAGARKLARAGKVALGWSLLSRRGCYSASEAWAGARTGNLRVHCGTRAPVLQLRWKRTPCKGLSRLRTQVLPVRIARGTR